MGFEGAFGGYSQSSQGQVVAITKGVFGTPHDLADAGTMSGVACPTTTQCFAVGADVVQVNHVSDEVPAALTITNRLPGRPTSILVPNNGQDPQLYSGDLAGIACQSSSVCVAVGRTYLEDQPVGDDTTPNGIIVPITNGAPGAVSFLPATAGYNGSTLDAVSCDSSQCLAVGSEGTEGVFVDVTGGRARTQARIAGTELLASVSCANGDCVAVGWAANSKPVAVDIDKGVAGTPRYGSGNVVQQSFFSVACAPLPNGQGTCLSGGEGTNSSVNASDLTVLGTTSALLSSPITLAAPGDWVIMGLACPGTTQCIGVGWSDAGQTEMSLITLPGCGAPTDQNGPASGSDLLHATLAAAGSCPLKVIVKKLEPTVRAGLEFHSPHFTDYPVDLIRAKPNNQTLSARSKAYQCESGCMDLLVTVTDPSTGKGVDGANVTASLDDLAPAQSAGAPTVVAGNQFLCAENDIGRDTNCGAHVDATTDENGQLVLRYYAPGAISIVSTAAARVGHRTGVQPHGVQEETGRRRAHHASCPPLSHL